MKKTVIGGVLTLAGAWLTGCIFVAAALFVPNMSTWQGTRLWYAIYGSGTYESVIKQSMALGVPFTAGVLMFALGLVVLGIEYFRPEENRRAPAGEPARPSSTSASAASPSAGLSESGSPPEEELPTMTKITQDDGQERI
ncbi:hypothetical protein QWJ34_13845 [Saccharibacillus sp. CPCC 101409]|uniref:hypothetical protein n=1 Tax=Saccharibacillus sp. CPCC 101409 TaxID=3058041 RepID=UPI0026728C5C|nr:hypothetical protein [Saccharibacillus sp. CPCC 101409]MDO3410850.1 hypothetical protein [Saccharibacillus sp. CPCC 101409]